MSPWRFVGALKVPDVMCFLMSSGDLRVALLKYHLSTRASLTASADFHGTANGVMPLVHPTIVWLLLWEKFRVFAAAMSLGEIWMLTGFALPGTVTPKGRGPCHNYSMSSHFCRVWHRS